MTETLEHRLNSSIPSLLAGNIRVLAFIHPEREMHNRFILTDIGGASYQTGLDDNEDGGSTPQDVVTWLSTSVYQREWTNFPSNNPVLSFG